MASDRATGAVDGCCSGPETTDHRLEMTAVDDQHSIQALVSDGADEPLGEWVGTRSTDRCADDPDALGVEGLVEGGCELGVPVPDQELDALSAFAEFVGEVPRLQTTQAPVGWSVTPVMKTLRVLSSMKNRT